MSDDFMQSPEFRALTREYLEYLQDLLPGVLERLKTAAHEDVYQYAHNIKGTGASYGFKNLSELGAEICEGIKAKKFDGIQEKLENIGSVIDSALLKL